MKVLRLFTVLIAVLALSACTTEFQERGLGGYSEDEIELVLTSEILAADALTDEEVETVSASKEVISKDVLDPLAGGGKMALELEPIEKGEPELVEEATEAESKDVYLKALGIGGIKQKVMAARDLAKLNDEEAVKAGETRELNVGEDGYITVRVEQGACKAVIKIDPNMFLQELGEKVTESATIKDAIVSKVTTEAAEKKAAEEPVEIIRK